MTTRSDAARKLQAFAVDLAAELGMTVTEPADDENPSGATIAGRNRTIHLYRPSYPSPDRVAVSGRYPGESNDVYVPREIMDPRITVGIDRDPRAVARDIERRVFPDYDKRHAYIVTAMAEAKTARTSQRSALVLIAEALGVPVPAETSPYSGSKITQVSAPIGDGHPWGDFRANHDGTSFTIELREVPAELAAQIAKLIRS